MGNNELIEAKKIIEQNLLEANRCIKSKNNKYNIEVINGITLKTGELADGTKFVELGSTCTLMVYLSNVEIIQF